MKILYPCASFYVSCTWREHLARPGYKREYAGVDFAGIEQPLHGSQHNGHTLQAHFSSQGYGYTTFVEYAGILRIRNAHQKNLGVKVGDPVGLDTYLGTLDTTGNSTGNHTHFEVWIKRGGVWHNVDPFNPDNGILLTHNKSEIVPLDGEEAPPMPEFEIPEIPELVKVTPTERVTKWINLRALPMLNSADLGDVRPGEVWEMFSSYTDVRGNVWFAVMKGNRIGWCAAYYSGEQWLREV